MKLTTVFDKDKEWKLWTVSILSASLSAFFLWFFLGFDFGPLWKVSVIFGFLWFFITGSLTMAELVHRYRGKYLNNQSGWMLAESLIGITIIVVGITAIMASYIQTTKSSSYSDKATQATYLGQSNLENFKKTYDGGTVLPVLPSNTITSDGFGLNWNSPTVNLPVSGLNITPVTVTVTWTDASSAQQKSIMLTAYFYYFANAAVA